jgi:hypothetical protein
MKTALLKPAGLAAVLAVIAGCASEPSVKVTRGPSQPPREPVDHGCGTVPGYDGIPAWALFGVLINPGDYIVNVSGEGIRVVSRQEFESEWEVVGDA